MSLRVVAICLLIFCVPVNAQEVSTGSIGEIEYSRAYPPNAQKQNGLLWSNVSEFSPQAGQTFEIKYAASKPATTSLSIFSADNDELIVLLDKVAVEPGVHRVVWDGKDGQGVLVPDEAYTPVVTLEYADGSLFVDDPRRYSGGETIHTSVMNCRIIAECSYVSVLMMVHW